MHSNFNTNYSSPITPAYRVTKDDYLKSKVTTINRIVNFFHRCVSIFSRKISVFTENAEYMSDKTYFRSNINKNMQFYLDSTTEKANTNLEPKITEKLTLEATQQHAIDSFQQLLNAVNDNETDKLIIKIPLYPTTGEEESYLATGEEKLNADQFIENYVKTLDPCIRLAEKEGTLKKGTLIKVIFNNENRSAIVKGLNNVSSAVFNYNQIIDNANLIIEKFIKERSVEDITKDLPNYGINNLYAMPELIDSTEEPNSTKESNVSEKASSAEVQINEGIQDIQSNNIPSNSHDKISVSTSDLNRSKQETVNDEQQEMTQKIKDLLKLSNLENQNSTIIQELPQEQKIQNLKDSLEDYEQIESMAKDILAKLNSLTPEQIDNKTQEMQDELANNKVELGNFHVSAGEIQHPEKLNLNKGYIMNAANAEGYGGGGVTGAIYKQASIKNHVDRDITNQFQQRLKDNPSLAVKNDSGEIIQTLGGIRRLAFGQCIVTDPLDLAEQGVQGIIHAVAPMQGEIATSDRILYIACLANCFKKAMLFATEQDNTEYLAMVLLGSGLYGGNPMDAFIAATIAGKLLKNNDKVNNLDIRMITYKRIGSSLIDIISKLKVIDEL
jgi:O-acetyl-ADP-ribose deacetylase (regulator of RNase III)